MRTTRSTLHINAPRAAVYGALVSADAIAAWRRPDDMTCEVHEFEAREGGTFRMTLTYDSPIGAGKTTAHSDTYHGCFARLIPDEMVVETIEFETADPTMGGTMTITTTLTDSGAGTDVVVVHQGIPAGVSITDNQTGTRMSLEKLASLVEPR